MQEIWVWYLGGEDTLEKGKYPGEGNGYPLQGSCLENSLDRGARQFTVQSITKESDVTETQQQQ